MYSNYVRPYNWLEILHPNASHMNALFHIIISTCLDFYLQKYRKVTWITVCSCMFKDEVTLEDFCFILFHFVCSTYLLVSDSEINCCVRWFIFLVKTILPQLMCEVWQVLRFRTRKQAAVANLKLRHHMKQNKIFLSFVFEHTLYFPHKVELSVYIFLFVPTPMC